MPYRLLPLLLLFLIAAILAITWPWVKLFSTAFLHHWDPPFHAWKLEFVARTLLSGHLLPPDGNTNMYYPHSGTLYFEALHWPQAVVAAILFGLTQASPILVYYIVLILFWALSGACLWMLLLALGTTRPAALLGAVVFTIMPYRISYMAEFNMQLCFGLPLFFFFMVRYFQRPSVRYACGMALAWWLQASSELYQAVFLLLILPFPALALMVPRRRLLSSFRYFWGPALCAATLGGLLSFVFLGPYLTMLNIHAVNRNLVEISHHILEPLSYLRPGGRFHMLLSFDVRRDEMIVYPTLALMVLATAYLFIDGRRLACAAAPRWVCACRAIRWASLLLFLLLTFSIYLFGSAFGLAAVYSILPVIAVLTSLLLLFHPTGRHTSTLFTNGLFVGALLAFFMSAGPQFAIRHAHLQIDNVLYLWIYNHLEALQGFRVVSRFSIFVLLSMVVAAALAWSQIERRWLRRPALRWLWILPVLLCALEAIPSGPFRSASMAYPLTTPVLEQLDRLERPYVIAMAPMGVRKYDSRYMLQIARTDRLFVYAWGGAYPHYTREVRKAMDFVRPAPEEAARLLRQLWPEGFILEDKAVSRRARIPCNFARVFSKETRIVAEDDRFVLLGLKPDPEPRVEQIRLIRRDLLQANSRLTFRARTPADLPSATLWLDLNGYVIGRWEISPESQEFRVVVPSRNILPILPNRFRFHATGDIPFFLDSFQPGPSKVADGPQGSGALAEACLPWLDHLQAVPSNTLPLDIHYPNGFAILACEPLKTTASPGESIRLRYYVQCPRDLQIAVNRTVRSRLCAPDGKWIEEGMSLATGGDLQDVQCQPHPAIYSLEQAIPIPERLVPGDYKLVLLLRNEKDRRQRGKQKGQSRKLFPVDLPIRIQAPAGP